MCPRAYGTPRHRHASWTFVVRLDWVLAVDLDPPCGACAAPPNYCPIRKTVRCMTQRIVTPCRRCFLARVHPLGRCIFRATHFESLTCTKYFAREWASRNRTLHPCLCKFCFISSPRGYTSFGRTSNVTGELKECLSIMVRCI